MFSHGNVVILESCASSKSLRISDVQDTATLLRTGSPSFKGRLLEQYVPFILGMISALSFVEMSDVSQ